MHDSAETISCKKLKRKASTLEESKVKQKNRSTWEMKRRLAEKRLMDLGGPDKKNEESCIIMETGTPIQLDTPQETRPTNVANSSTSVSKSAMEKAEELQAKLPHRCPSFVKLMLKSHVSGGFWLGLIKKFCVKHLPKNDEMIGLVDENGEEYRTKYLVDKNGLSGGWRGFSIAHNLLPDDVLVFQLIEPCKFKVYIVRARSSTKMEAVTSIQNSNFDEEEAYGSSKQRRSGAASSNSGSKDLGKLAYLSEVSAASECHHTLGICSHFQRCQIL